MIELITAKEFSDLWNKLQEVIERTKRHTEQIKELEKKIKLIEKA